MNVPSVILKLVDFLGLLADFVYNFLYYHIEFLNCEVIDLLFVLGIPALVTILIIKIVRG